MALLLGYFAHIGMMDIPVKKPVLDTFREFGLRQTRTNPARMYLRHSALAEFLLQRFYAGKFCKHTHALCGFALTLF